MDYKNVKASKLPKDMFRAFILLDVALAVFFHDEIIRIFVSAWNSGQIIGHQILGY